MGTKRLFCAIVSSLVLAACTAWQQGLTPGVIGASPTPDPLEALHIVGTAGRPADHLIVRGARPKNCPGKFIYCVTVSRLQEAHLYFCYSPGSYCGGPSQYQYRWIASFTDRQGHPVKYFSALFNPNPGDPTYNTIGEWYRVKSTNGAYKYVEWVCPYIGAVCQSKVYVGIAVQ